MKKFLAVFVAMLVLCAWTETRAAGWVDPFKSGSSGFSDPFKGQDAQGGNAAGDESGRQKKDAGKDAEKAKKKDDGKSGDNAGKDAKKPDKFQNYYDKVREGSEKKKSGGKKDSSPDARDLSNQNNAEIMKGIMSQINIYKKLLDRLDETKADKRLTPYGVFMGDQYAAAKKDLMTLLKAGARCKDGDVFYADPVNVCVGILLHGQPELNGTPEEKVTGASMWLSKQCLKDDMSYDSIYKFMAKRGLHEYKDGWTTGEGIEGCLSAVRDTPDEMMPGLFGQLSMRLRYEDMTYFLEKLGAKKVKDYSNGCEMLLDGSRIFIEYCNYGNRQLLVSVAVDVGRESDRVAQLIDNMRIRKELIKSKSGQILSKRGPDGRIAKFEYFINDNDYKCRAGQS